MQKVRKVSIFDKTCQNSSWAHLRSNLSINAYCNFTKKIRKVLKRQFYSKLKNLILGPFCPLFPQNNIFPKKIISVKFKTLYCCRFMRKLEKSPNSQNLKNLILGSIWAFSPY